jgi:hypothetical protein
VTTSGLTNLDLGTLPGFPQFSAANAVSSDGSVLYGIALYNNIAGGQSQAVRFTSAGPTIVAIPFLNGGDNTSAPVARGTSAAGSPLASPLPIPHGQSARCPWPHRRQPSTGLS